jgi:hypothetical protein
MIPIDTMEDRAVLVVRRRMQRAIRVPDVFARCMVAFRLTKTGRLVYRRKGNARELRACTACYLQDHTNATTASHHNSTLCREHAEEKTEKGRGDSTSFAQCNSCTQAVCVLNSRILPTCTMCKTPNLVFTCDRSECSMVDGQQSRTKDYCYMCRPVGPKKPSIMCKCSKPARMATSRKGKSYYNCPGWPQNGCNFFVWDTSKMQNIGAHQVSYQKTGDPEPVTGFDFELPKRDPRPKFDRRLTTSMRTTDALPGDSYTPGDGAYYA